MYSFPRHHKHRAGFTLLEVMVVIVILGILASLVVLANRALKSRQHLDKSSGY